MKIVSVKAERIKVGDRARSEMGDIKSLADAIREKGLLQPITIDKNYALVAGGRRLAACKEAGLEDIPCIIRNSIDELDLLEVELMENCARKDMTWVERAKLEKRIYEAKKSRDPKWGVRDQATLMDEGKSEVARRIELATVMEVIPELAEMRTQNDAWKAYKKAEEETVVRELTKKASTEITQAAALAERHYIVGDAREQIKKINERTVHFVEVDPPYAIDLDKKKGRNKNTSMMDNYNEVVAGEYPDFIRDIASNCYRGLGDNGFCVWWFAFEWYGTVQKILREVGFSVGDVPCLWYKGSVGQTASPDTMLASSYEPFFLARKGQPKVRKPGRSNVFHFTPVAPQKKIHPTERPIELMMEIFDTLVYPSSRVLVPFLGSGVTLRAAYYKNCMGYGWDLDEMTKRRFLNQVLIDRGIMEDNSEEDEEGE